VRPTTTGSRSRALSTPGEANYNALEVEKSHKMSHGFYLDANDTLAKNLADNQGDTPTAFADEANYGVPISLRYSQ
jgi:hypothetical protein